jgi:hypothetical protein
LKLVHNARTCVVAVSTIKTTVLFPCLQQFCAAEVRPDDGEASHPSMMALVNALGIAAVLRCVDMTDGGVEIPLPPETGNVSPVVATLLYMPGHYNVLYAS